MLVSSTAGPRCSNNILIYCHTFMLCISTPTLTLIPPSLFHYSGSSLPVAERGPLKFRAHRALSICDPTGTATFSLQCAPVLTLGGMPIGSAVLWPHLVARVPQAEDWASTACPNAHPWGWEWVRQYDCLIIYVMGKRQLLKRRRGIGKTQTIHIQAVQSTERNLNRQRGVGN